MSFPTPADPPLDGDTCASWAQVDELAPETRELLTDDVWCAVLAKASDVLWAATGRRWRNASHTETIAIDSGLCGYPLLRPTRPEDRGRDMVRLPRPDVTAVVAVEEADGTPVTGWELDGLWLVRRDHARWRRDTRVTYTYGRIPPVGGRMAVLTLAAEIGRSFANRPCSLPARVQAVTRQGISYTVLDDLDFLDQGLTGLYAVDVWIRSVNPGRNRRQAVSWSPDRTPTRRP